MKKNMKEKLLTPTQNFFLNKRGIIETIIGLLKNQCQIEHTRHRKPENAFVCLISGLLAYQLKPKKPTVKTKTLSPNLKALY
jgi:hypothetical protein